MKTQNLLEDFPKVPYSIMIIFLVTTRLILYVVLIQVDPTHNPNLRSAVLSWKVNLVSLETC